MKISNGEYSLRTFTAEDDKVLFEISHDGNIKEFVPYAYCGSLEEASENVSYYVDGDLINDFYLLIEKNSAPVGVIIANRTEKKVLEISDFVAKDFRNRGIMTIAMKMFINWLKKNTDYEKLNLAVHKENIASNKQVSKIGGILCNSSMNYNLYEIYLK